MLTFTPGQRSRYVGPSTNLPGNLNELEIYHSMTGSIETDPFYTTITKVLERIDKSSTANAGEKKRLYKNTRNPSAYNSKDMNNPSPFYNERINLSSNHPPRSKNRMSQKEDPARDKMKITVHAKPRHNEDLLRYPVRPDISSLGRDEGV